MDTDAVKHEIHTLEDRRYQPMQQGDAATLAQLLGDELVYTHSSGAVDTKESYLASVRAQQLTYRSIERRDEQIHVYGDSAVLTGRGRIDVVIAGVPRLIALRYLSV